jgi:zinc protease
MKRKVIGLIVGSVIFSIFFLVGCTKENEEYKKFFDNGINKDELELAKNSLMSSFNLRFASLFNIAGQLQVMMAENLGRDFLEKRQDVIKNIKLEDVNRVIKQRIGRKRVVFVARGEVL